MLTKNLNHLLKLVLVEMLSNFPYYNLTECAELGECEIEELKYLLTDEKELTANRALEVVLNLNDCCNILEDEVLEDIASQIEMEGVNYGI